MIQIRVTKKTTFVTYVFPTKNLFFSYVVDLHYILLYCINYNIVKIFLAGIV